MRLESGDLRLEAVSNVDDRRDGREHHRRTSGQGEVGGVIIELLSLMRAQSITKLFRIILASSCPLKGQACEQRCQGMVRMPGDSPIRTERDQHLRSKLPDLPRKLAHYLKKILFIKPPVGIVQHQTSCH